MLEVDRRWWHCYNGVLSVPPILNPGLPHITRSLRTFGHATFRLSLCKGGVACSCHVAKIRPVHGHNGLCLRLLWLLDMAACRALCGLAVEAAYASGNALLKRVLGETARGHHAEWHELLSIHLRGIVK